MEQELVKKLEEQGKKLDAIFASTEKTRKYLWWAVVISVGVIVLPLIGLAFEIPWFLNVINTTYKMPF